jgi:hypothetical protein
VTSITTEKQYSTKLPARSSHEREALSLVDRATNICDPTDPDDEVANKLLFGTSSGSCNALMPTSNTSLLFLNDEDNTFEEQLSSFHNEDTADMPTIAQDNNGKIAGDTSIVDPESFPVSSIQEGYMLETTVITNDQSVTNMSHTITHAQQFRTNQQLMQTTPSTTKSPVFESYNTPKIMQVGDIPTPVAQGGNGQIHAGAHNVVTNPSFVSNIATCGIEKGSSAECNPPRKQYCVATKEPRNQVTHGQPCPNTGQIMLSTSPPPTDEPTIMSKSTQQTSKETDAAEADFGYNLIESSVLQVSFNMYYYCYMQACTLMKLLFSFCIFR